MLKHEPLATAPPSRQLALAWAASEAQEGRDGLPRYVRDCLDAIIERGGSTADEVSARLNLPHQSASAGVTKLFQAGWIEDSGRRRLTRRGRAAVVWQVIHVPSGEPRAKRGNRMAAMCVRLREEARELAIACLIRATGMGEPDAASIVADMIEERRAKR